MTESVVIVGGGVAGLAAAWSAARHGLSVRLFDNCCGVSALVGGAVDDRPWEQVARAVEVRRGLPRARPLPDEVTAFVEALGIWQLPLPGEPLTRLATEAGRVRVARGHDRSLLDWSSIPEGGRVVLPRSVRAEWDADSLARALQDDAYVRSRKLRVEAIDAQIHKLRGEDRIAAADIAILHDEPDRLAWLCASLTDACAEVGQVDAMLTGPWLGAERALAPALGDQLGFSVGEILSAPGSAAGLRFENGRTRLLDDMAIRLEPHTVTAVEGDGRPHRLRTETSEQAIVADKVILAIGGVAAGGIRYTPPEQEAQTDAPPYGCVPFSLSLDAPVALQVAGRRLDVVSSLFGPTLDELAWPVDPDPGWLEAVGIACDGVCAGPEIFVAGDAVADTPRTVLQAVFSGVAAGKAAAS